MATAFLATAGGKALMSGLGQGIGSGAMGALSGLFGGKSGGTDIGASMALMNHQDKLQRDYTKWLNENQYSQMRTGLENAGYNPLLAVGSGVSPTNGSVGIGNAVSGNTAQFSGEKALQSLVTLAQVKNIQADTDMKNAGIITKFLGTKFVKSAEGKIKGWLDGITNSANDIKNVSDDVQTLLKGYVSNTANSGDNLPKPFSYQPDYDDKGNLDNTELKELKMIKKIERRRKRYGL